MKTTLLVTAGVLSCAGAFGQSARTSYSGQSWVGLLVSASCESKQSNRNAKANAEADLTTSDRVTTPAVDASGTRGKSTLMTPQTGDQPDTNAAPRTGDVRADNADATDPAWKTARKQAGALPKTCSIDANTNRFGLVLPDGRMLVFDDLANQGILNQLKTKQIQKSTVLRVQAVGKMQNGRIALDSITM